MVLLLNLNSTAKHYWISKENKTTKFSIFRQKLRELVWCVLKHTTIICIEDHEQHKAKLRRWCQGQNCHQESATMRVWRYWKIIFLKLNQTIEIGLCYLKLMSLDSWSIENLFSSIITTLVHIHYKWYYKKQRGFGVFDVLIKTG